MEQLKAAVDRAAGRDVFLIGEGWNFGEVANGARFVQASQLSLNGTGIGTFSDRARERMRGGGCVRRRQRLQAPGLRERPVLRSERSGQRPHPPPT